MSVKCNFRHKHNFSDECQRYIQLQVPIITRFRKRFVAEDIFIAPLHFTEQNICVQQTVVQGGAEI